MGLIDSAIAGAFAGAGKVGAENYTLENHERIKSELEMQRASALDQLHRESYQSASQAADVAEQGAHDRNLTEDAAGNVTRQDLTPTQRARARAGAYDAEGLPDAASRLRTEALQGDRLDLERSSLGHREAQDERYHQERLVILNRQLEVQQRQLEHAYSLDSRQSTALSTNVRFLVDQNIAKTPSEAFDMLHERMMKSPKETLLTMTNNIIRGDPMRYRGDVGRQRAVSEAQSLINQVNSIDSETFQGSYNEGKGGGAPSAAAGVFDSGDAVRDAYRAGRIDRETALDRLKQFGYE